MNLSDLAPWQASQCRPFGPIIWNGTKPRIWSSDVSSVSCPPLLSMARLVLHWSEHPCIWNPLTSSKLTSTYVMIFSLASRAECIVAVKLIFSVIFSYIEQSIGRRFSWVEDIPAISKSSHCVYDYKENHGSPSMMYCFFYNIASKRKTKTSRSLFSFDWIPWQHNGSLSFREIISTQRNFYQHSSVKATVVLAS